MPFIKRSLTRISSISVVPSAFIPAVGIIISETLFNFQFPNLALAGHIITLIVCTLGPLHWEVDLPVFQAFTLLPVFRLVNLGMPIFFESPIYGFILIYLPMIPAVLLIANYNDSVDLRFGVRKAIFLLPIGIVLALALGWAEHALTFPEPMIPTLTPLQIGLLGGVMITQVAFVEELIFRGILQNTLIGRFGSLRGILLAAILFAMMYSVQFSSTFFGFAFIAGLVYGVLYYKLESLTFVILIHGIANILLFAIFPLRGAVVLLG